MNPQAGMVGTAAYDFDHLQVSLMKKGSLGFIFFVMLMDIIGITLLSPVAPKIILKYSDSALIVTLIPVVYAAGQFLAAPLLGKISDKVGRRPVLLLSLV